MAVIVYDLDHTLIDSDCSELWLQYLTETGRAGAELIKEAERQHQLYLAGTLDMQDYLKMILQTHVGQTTAEVTANIDQFIAGYVVPYIRPQAVDNIRDHQKAGDRCLVISASVEFLVAPIARYLGVDDAIGVRVELVDNKITGNGSSVICYQEGKVHYFKQWLALNNESSADCWFYSDSHNDLPLLEAAANPVAVTPDPSLLAVAQERNWQVVYW